MALKDKKASGSANIAPSADTLNDELVNPLTGKKRSRKSEIRKMGKSGTRKVSFRKTSGRR